MMIFFKASRAAKQEEQRLKAQLQQQQAEVQQQLRQQQQLQQQQHPNSTSSKMVATEEQLQLAHLKRRQLQLQQQQNQVAQQIKNTFPFTQMLNTLHCPQIQLTHLAPPSREDSLNLTSAVWFSWGVLLNSGIGEGEQSDRPRLLLLYVPLVSTRRHGPWCQMQLPRSSTSPPPILPLSSSPPHPPLGMQQGHKREEEREREHSFAPLSLPFAASPQREPNSRKRNYLFRLQMLL